MTYVSSWDIHFMPPLDARLAVASHYIYLIHSKKNKKIAMED